MATSHKCSTNLTIHHPFGLHARPAAMLVELAGTYDARISIGFGRHRASASSIMSLLMLGAGQGSQVVVTAVGRDAPQAIFAIEKLFASNFIDTATRPGPEYLDAKRPQPVSIRQPYEVTPAPALAAAHA